MTYLIRLMMENEELCLSCKWNLDFRIPSLISSSSSSGLWLQKTNPNRFIERVMPAVCVFSPTSVEIYFGQH